VLLIIQEYKHQVIGW